MDARHSGLGGGASGCASPKLPGVFFYLRHSGVGEGGSQPPPLRVAPGSLWTVPQFLAPRNKAQWERNTNKNDVKPLQRWKQNIGQNHWPKKNFKDWYCATKLMTNTSGVICCGNPLSFCDQGNSQPRAPCTFLRRKFDKSAKIYKSSDVEKTRPKLKRSLVGSASETPPKYKQPFGRFLANTQI